MVFVWLQDHIKTFLFYGTMWGYILYWGNHGFLLHKIIIQIDTKKRFQLLMFNILVKLFVGDNPHFLKWMK